MTQKQWLKATKGCVYKQAHYGADWNIRDAIVAFRNGVKVGEAIERVIAVTSSGYTANTQWEFSLLTP